MPRLQPWLDWLTQDPTGRLAGAGLVVLLGLALLFVALAVFNTLRRHWKTLVEAALLVGGAVWAVQFFQPSMGSWLVIAGIGFAMFLGFALFLTQRGTRGMS